LLQTSFEPFEMVDALIKIVTYAIS
jgi:hypothetical protein